MKKLIPVFCLLAIYGWAAPIFSQHQIEIGKYKFLVPDTTTEFNSFGLKHYFKIQNDTIFYYEIDEEESEYYVRKVNGPSDEEEPEVRFEIKIVEVEVYVCPLKAIDPNDLTLEEVINEKVDGAISKSYRTVIHAKYALNDQDPQSWYYHYKAKGKMKSYEVSTIRIYSDSRSIFDRIASLITK